jgi:hypothetical protein
MPGSMRVCFRFSPILVFTAQPLFSIPDVTCQLMMEAFVLGSRILFLPFHRFYRINPRKNVLDVIGLCCLPLLLMQCPRRISLNHLPECQEQFARPVHPKRCCRFGQKVLMLGNQLPVVRWLEWVHKQMYQLKLY